MRDLGSCVREWRGGMCNATTLRAYPVGGRIDTGVRHACLHRKGWTGYVRRPIDAVSRTAVSSARTGSGV
jgi:hypothetical protein